MSLFQTYNLELSTTSRSAPQHWLGCQVRTQCSSSELLHVTSQEILFAAPASEDDSISTPPQTMPTILSSSDNTVAIIGGVVAVVLIVAVATTTAVIVVALVLKNRRADFELKQKLAVSVYHNIIPYVHQKQDSTI